MPLPDGEVVARDWVWNNTAVRALLDNGDSTYRCATELPVNPVFPFVTVTQIDAVYPETNIPMGDIFIQFDCYGAKGWDATPVVLSPDVRSSSIVARTIVDELRAAASISLTPSGTYNNDAFVYGVQIVGGPRRVGEEMGWSRQLVEALFTIREA